MYQSVWELYRLQHIICAINTQKFFGFDISLGGCLLFEVDKDSLKVFFQEKLFLPGFQMVKDTNDRVLKQKMTRKKIYTPILSKLKCSLSHRWKGN